MQILTHTPHDAKGRDSIVQLAETEVENTLGHLSEHITRVEIHLRDENAKKGGESDKHCLMEARLEHHQPITAEHNAATVDQAIQGAAEKLKHALDHTLGRLGRTTGR
jgi:ribosome-associated translation inhibitor RaiA